MTPNGFRLLRIAGGRARRDGAVSRSLPPAVRRRGHAGRRFDGAAVRPARRSVAAGEVAVRRAARGGAGRHLLEPFTGDFDEMVKRRVIRAGVVYNRTQYFIDEGVQRGISYESLKLFEEQLNKRLKTGLMTVHVAIVPLGARPAVLSARIRPGRPRRGDADDHAGPPQGRRLQQPDAHRRVRNRGDEDGDAGPSPAPTISRAARCPSVAAAATTRACSA